jgi:hypothetical protein
MQGRVNKYETQYRFRELTGEVTVTKFLGFFNLLEEILAPARSPIITHDEESFSRKSDHVDTRAGPEVAEVGESILRLDRQSTRSEGFLPTVENPVEYRTEKYRQTTRFPQRQFALEMSTKQSFRRGVKLGWQTRR